MRHLRSLFLSLLFLQFGLWSATVTPPSINTPQQANEFLGGPTSGANALPQFRALGTSDIFSSALGTGTANSTMFLRGDRTWQTIPAGAALPFRLGTSTTADALADSLFATSGTTKKALVLQMSPSQTGDPFEIQNSTGAAVFLVTPGGTVFTSSSITAYGGLTTGDNAGHSPSIHLYGTTSGSATLTVAAAAGSPTFQLPATNGTSAYTLQTDGSGNTSWGLTGVAGGGTGLATLTAHALYVGNGTSAPTALAVPSIPSVLYATGTVSDPSFAHAITLGGVGNAGSIAIQGSTSGLCNITVAAAAGTPTTFQLPATNGTNGYFLKTNGSGITSWSAAGGGLVTGTITTPDALADNIISPTATTQKSLVIQRQSGQTANMFEAQSENGNPFTSINNNGQLVTGSTSELQNGTILFNGSTSGTASLNVLAVAGTTNFTLPVGNGTNGYVLKTNGSGVTSWAAAGGLVSGAITTADALADNIISPTATTQKSLVIQAQPSQTANLFEAQDSTGAQLATLAASGALTLPTAYGTKLSMPSFADSNATVQITAAAANYNALVVQGYSGQYTNLMNFEDNTGSLLSSVDYAGNFTVPNMASSTASIVNALYFNDSTPPTAPGSGGYFYATGGHPSAIGTAGIGTPLAPHVEDGPAAIYDMAVGKENVVGHKSYFEGEIEWINYTRLARKLDGETTLGKCRIIETFSDYTKRTGTVIVKQDWNTHVATLQADHNKKVIAQTARKADHDTKQKAHDTAVAAKAKIVPLAPPIFNEPTIPPFIAPNKPKFLP